MKNFKKLFLLGMLLPVSMLAMGASTPEDLGWEAGVVAPSPLKSKYATPLFQTIEEVEQAKALADEELDRVKKLREGQHYLCNQKILVNSCINKAEKVLKDRERFAEQLKRTADHQIRQIKINNQQKKADPEPPQPTRRGEVKTVKEASMPTKRGVVSEPNVTRHYEKSNCSKRQRLAKSVEKPVKLVMKPIVKNVKRPKSGRARTRALFFRFSKDDVRIA